jgi:hypothetical protein
MARGLGAHHRPAIAEANGPTGARATREDVPHGESLQGSLHQHQVAWELSRNTPSAIGVALMVPRHARTLLSIGLGQPATFGVRGAGSTGRLMSFLTRSKNRGAALRATGPRCGDLPALALITAHRLLSICLNSLTRCIKNDRL